ncbi:hypothetical protein EW145_g6667 [Phellinidium pouzarii]|uniref:Peroxidase n=1 Tax=Phellinidium pouzarii TaxID=167371 RepID=A0A4S4KW40_9AGAM|nr:hypothetical protein EW145_g6667 [Phellinidium pouzarii]
MVFKELFALASVAASLSGSYAAITKHVPCPDGIHTATNTACCTWFTILDDLQANLFDNECGQEAREALRLTFHDAMGFSPETGGGGADGSIITFASTELTYAANDDGGVQDIVTNLTPFVSKYNVTPGDLVFFAGVVGLSNCPGAPTGLQFLTGRPLPVAAAPDGLVSLPTDSVSTILARFADVGFSADEVVALLASHSVAAADGISGTGHGAPFDSTAAVFDSQFFVETQLNETLPGAVRLPSDGLLARDNRTACTWQGFVTDEDGMRSAFAAALIKLSVVAQTTSDLTDCSEVIPGVQVDTAEPYFPGTLTITDVDQACTATPFPTLTQDAAVTSLAPV